MTPISFNALAWIEDHGVALIGMEHGFVTSEELIGAAYAFEEFMRELEAEWTPEKLKEWVVARKREEYQRTAQYILTLEERNRDARANGQSYVNRKELTARIKTGRRLLQDIKQAGKEAKAKTYTLRDYVDPTDMPKIQKNGLEQHLKSHFL